MADDLYYVFAALEHIGDVKRILSKELRTTSQRVNLFEKVKIPEAKENIRVINIFLGDQQTSGVARSKLAKGKATARTAALDALAQANKEAAA